MFTVPGVLCAGLEDVLLERIYGSRDAATARPRTGPEARVGQRCRVFWREDQDWYEAVCRAYDPEKRSHNLWYIYDEEVGHPPLLLPSYPHFGDCIAFG